MPDTFDTLTGTARQPERNVQTSDPIVTGKDTQTFDLSAESVRTPVKLREVAKELTRYGLLEAARKPNLYRVLQSHQLTVSAILEPLDLDVTIDDVRGIAFITVRSDDTDDAHLANDESDPEDWSHPLVRRQRLTLEQSLLIAILRQRFVAHEQEAGVGADDARVAVDELIPEFQAFLGDPGSEAKERTRMLTLLDQLKGHGLVSEPDGHERVTIRPIIAHLASPENLLHLLAWLRQQRAGDST